MQQPMLSPTLVGRRRELEALAAAMREAAANNGSLTAVVGESGLGKSRLVREAIPAAQQAGMKVLIGRGVERAAPIPLRPLAEAVQAAFRHSPPPVDASLAPFLPALARLHPAWSRHVGETSEAPGFVIAEGLTRLLAHHGKERGCLLVLEDLHWADPETLEAVEYLADHLAEQRTHVVVTVRTGEQSAAAALLERLVRRQTAAMVQLSPLPDDEVDRMVEACLGSADVPADVRTFMREHCEGVPLFVEELLTGLTQSRALVRAGAQWQLQARLTPAVPPTFGEAVGARLHALSAEAAQVVAAAAVVGRRFDWRLLPDITQLDEDVVLAALRDAVGVGLVDSGGTGDQMRFRHALTRDAIRDRLLGPERRMLADRALDAISAAHPDLDGEWCALAAELAEEAGHDQRCATLLVEVARRAMAEGAIGTAGAALERARPLADPSMQLTVDELDAQAAALAGEVDRAVEVAAAVLRRLAANAEDATRRAQLHLAIARAAVTGARWEVARHNVDAAGALASSAAVSAAVHALAAQVAMAEGRLDEAQRLALAAISDGDGTDAAAAVCEAHEVLGRCARLEHLTQAEEHFQAARRTAEAAGLKVWRARALHELGTIDLLSTHRTDRLLQARHAATEAGAVATVALVDLHLSSIALAEWQPEEAAAHAVRCVELSRRLRLGTLGMGLVHLASACGQAGDEAGMETALQEAAAAAGDDVDVAAGVPGRGRLMLALRRADFGGALGHLDEATEILRRDPATAFPFLGLRALLATALRSDGEARRGARVAAGGGLSFNRALTELADVIADPPDDRGSAIRERFETSMVAWSAPPAPVWRGLVAVIVATGTNEHGMTEPLREALAVFEDAGYVELAAAARAALRRAGEAVPRRGRGDAHVPVALRSRGVTSREMDVLLLVGEGLGNREIAGRLHLSPRTVERHVANLLDKFGAPDRKALVGLTWVAPTPN